MANTSTAQNQVNPQLIDSHCHLDYPPLLSDLHGVVSRADLAGVTAMIAISTQVAVFDKLLEAIEPHKRVGCSVGTHPHRAGTEQVSVDDLLSAANHPRVVAIGESGLDYHHDFAPIQSQERAFLTHINAAQESGLPLVIHSRNADKHMERVLRESYKKRPFSAVLHCYSGGIRLAQCAIELGFYVSASGIITFRNADEVKSVFANLPQDRLLVETDAPYLAPSPHRGKSNEPAYVVHTAKALADLHGCEYSEMARTTRENTLRLFPRLGDIIDASRDENLTH